MKNIITFSVKCVIAGLLFSSCGTNVSITKRHYNDGYYISYSNDKRCAPPQKKKEKEETLLPQMLTPFHSTAENKRMEGTRDTNSVSSISISTRSNKNRMHKAIPGEVRKPLPNNHPKLANNPVARVNQELHKITTTNSSERDGLSLFWIVILIILILWAIGFLAGGFGGLIHLLLLIALILFILWLLRII